jgi:hypothetical protein
LKTFAAPEGLLYERKVKTLILRILIYIYAW